MKSPSGRNAGRNRRPKKRILTAGLIFGGAGHSVGLAVSAENIWSHRSAMASQENCFPANLIAAVLILARSDRSDSRRRIADAHPSISVGETRTPVSTLQTGREPLNERLAVIAPDIDRLIVQLEQFEKSDGADALAGNVRDAKGEVHVSGKAESSDPFPREELDLVAIPVQVQRRSFNY
jgi:hypothetical protein